MKMLDILTKQLDDLVAERNTHVAVIEALPEVLEAEARSATDAEDAEYRSAVDAIEVVDGKIDGVRAEIAKLEKIAERKDTATRRSPVAGVVTAGEVRDVRYLTPLEARDAAMRIVERDGHRFLNERQTDALDRLLRTRNEDTDGDVIARMLIVTESDAYRSAFAKMMTNNGHLLVNDEQRALEQYTQIRAASSSSAAGGYGVPVLIDPTIIITSGAADAPILAVSRVETITTDTWKGVSSAGMSWSFDSEAAEVSDDAATLAQPSVSVHETRGFIPYSIRIGMDYPNFAEEMSALLAQGFTDQRASITMTGTGSGQPFGIFTALDANTNVEVVVTTDGAFGAVDIRKVWGQLPERYRSRSNWVFSVTVENQIRSWSTSGTGSDYTISLGEGGVPQLTGRRVLLTDYAPAYTGTTGAANIAIVGDFSNYLIAQRAGMTVEAIPHLFSTSNGRPTGSRGWFAWARWGADSINDLGFRLLQNQ